MADLPARVSTTDSEKMPIPGRYYARNGFVLLCIAVRRGLDTYYWFVDAEKTPMTVLSGYELAANPATEVALPIDL